MSKSLRVLVTCLWVVLAIALIYMRGRSLGLDRYVTDRLRFHAVPVAISEHYRGHIHDYTGYGPLAFRFQQPAASLDELIQWALEAPVSPEDPPYYWAADDRGTADYVIGAFVLFGPRLSSLYKFYFVVLGVSCALFLIGYRRQPGMFAVLFFALAAIYASLPVVPLANLSAEVFEPPSIYEPRILDMLALVATLHLACAAWASERPRGWTAALIGQIAVFVFCYHARSSLAWEAAFIILINVATLMLMWRRRDRRRVWVPLVLFFAGLAAFNGYKHAVYNPRYFKDIGERVVWHNALMGFGSSRALSVRYKLDVNDAKAIDAVIRYLRQHHDPRLTADWTPSNILNSFGGHFEFDWYAYESAARDLYFDIWKNNTREALRTYLVDKPLDTWNVMKLTWTQAGMEQRDRHDLYFRPFGIVPLLLVLPALALGVVYSVPAVALVAAMAALVLTSFIPGLMFYSVPLTMMGTFLGVALVAYGLILAVARGVLSWWRRPSAVLPDRDAAVAATAAIAAWTLAITAMLAPQRVVGFADTGAAPRKVVDAGKAPPPPFVAVRMRGRTVQARQYVWPASVGFDAKEVASWKSTDLGTPIYTAPELRPSKAGMTVKGTVGGAYTYLLRLEERSLAEGSYFFATGVVDTGGLSVGLQTGGRWAGFVNIDSPGPFAVVIKAEDAGRYSLVLSNCVNGAVAGRPVVNALRIDRAGWVDADAHAPAAASTQP